MPPPLKLSLIVEASGKEASAELAKVKTAIDEVGASAERAGKSGKSALGDLDAAAEGSEKSVRSFGSSVLDANADLRDLALGVGDVGSNVGNTGSSIDDFARSLGLASDRSADTGSNLSWLGSVAGGALGYFAALAIEIGASFVGSLLDTQSASEAAAEALSNLTSVTSAYQSATEAAFSTDIDLRQTYGAGVEEARKLLEIERARANILAEQAAKQAIAGFAGTGLAGQFDDAMAQLQSIAQASFLSEASKTAGIEAHLESLRGKLGLAADDVAVLVGKMDMLGRTEGAANQARAIQDIISYTIEAAGGVQNITGETALWFDQLLQIGDETARIAAHQELNVARGQDMLASYQSQAELAALTAQYGADSAQVALAKLQAEQQVVAAKVEALGLSESESAAIMDAWAQANGLTDAILASALATSNVVYGIGDISAAFNPAIVKAGQLALAIRQASAIPGMSNPDPNAPFDADAEMEQARTRASLFVAPSGGGVGAGGGGGGAAAQARGIESLIAAQERELELLRETDPVQKELLRHREAMASATEAEKAQLTALVSQRQQEEAAIKAATEAQEAYRDMAYGALEDLILKGASVKETLAGLAGQLAKLLLQAALLGTGPMAGLFGGGGLGGGLFGLIGLGAPKADGGMIHGAGGPREDEELTPTSAGEFISNSKATSRHRTLLETLNAGGDPAQLQAAPTILQQQAPPQRLEVDLKLSDDLDARVEAKAQDISISVMRTGLAEYSAKALPRDVRSITGDPRRRR